MNTETSPKDCMRLMQELINVMNVSPELLDFIKQFITNLQKSDNRQLICSAIDSLFAAECHFTKENLEQFKTKIKDIVPPKFLHDLEVPIENIKLVDYFTVLGEGKFSVVILGDIVKNNKYSTVAAKMVKQKFDGIFSEISNMSKLSHLNILPIVGCNVENGIILTEVMEKGTLLNVCTVFQTTEKLYKYIFDVIKGLQYMHDNKFIHRDLHIENILVDKNENCKIGDFGFAIQLGMSGEFINNEIPLQFYHAAPEVINKQRFSYASDIYSFGLLIREVMLCPEMIIRDVENIKTLKKEKPKRCPGNLDNISRRSFENNPNQRPSLKNFYSIIECLLNP